MEEEISLKEIFIIIKKKIWLILFITVFATLISGILSYFVIKPTYEATTTLMIGKPTQSTYNPDNPMQYQEVQTNRMLVTTYSAIAKSRSVAEQVINKLKLGITPEQFASLIDVSSVGDTELIQIKADAKTPRDSVSLCDTTADVFMNKITQIMKVDNVQTVDDAIPDYTPVKPKPVLNMAIAAVIGLMVSIFLVFLLEYIDDTIKTNDDVEKYLNLPILGNIPFIKEEKNGFR